MADEHIECRTYIGETSTITFDGWASFCIDQQYQLRYTRDEMRHSTKRRR